MVQNSTIISFSKNDLIRKKLGGGCIVNQRPVFSRDGSVIFVGEKLNIHVYSTITGEYIRSYNLTENYIVNWNTIISKPDIVVICTNKGELIFWDWKQGVETSYVQLKVYSDANIEQCEFLSLETDKTVELLATWTQGSNNKLTISVYNQSRNEFYNMRIDLINKHHSLSVSMNSKLYAIVQDNKVNVGMYTNKSKTIRHLISEGRHFTCVTCHPNEECIATGDNTGRVLLWRNIFNRPPIQAVYHWHTLPVASISFSVEGTHMYTAGSECVLVKWDVDAPKHRNFLPRVQAPIKHIAVSYDNLLVAMSMTNNAVYITDTQRNLKVILSNMSWGVISTPNGNFFGAGLHYDPKSESIILNSHVGHIQFYNLFFNKLLYNLDITGHNKLTEEQSDVIVNIDVVKIALSTFGMWLATVEERCDKDAYFECRLKFWNFDSTDQKWALNTCVSLPHENGVTDIKFKPSQSRNLEMTNMVCVSIGQDKTFKVWNLVDSTIHGQTHVWKSIATGYYLNKQPSCIDFSYDGSLLAIGFMSTLTIWVPDTCELKCVLSSTLHASEFIKQVIFGNCGDCHLVVTITSNRICVWNLLSLTLLWNVPIKVNLLCKDSKSNYIAAFTETNKLFVFTPQHSTPVYVHENVCDDNFKVLQAIFVPQKIIKSTNSWQQYSQLYFIDSKQELLTLEEKSLKEDNHQFMESVVKSKTYNPFLSLKAHSTISDIHKFDSLKISRNELHGAIDIKKIIQMPSHTCAPMRYMCVPVLKSMLKSNKTAVKGDEEMDLDI